MEEPEDIPEAQSEDEEEAPRNTQKRRQAPPSSDDEEEPKAAEEAAGDEMEVDGGGTENESEQLVKKLVRYVLACEYSRLPIRREGIRDKGVPKRTEKIGVFRDADCR